MSKKKLLIKIVQWLVILAVVYFFAATLKQNWDQVQQYDLSFNSSAFLAVGLLMFAVAVSGYLWGLIIRKLAKREVSVSEAVEVHIVSWLLKYIPGQVGSITNKLAWAHKNHVDKKVTTASFVYENLFMVTAGLLLGLPLLGIFLDQFQYDWLFFILGFIYIFLTGLVSYRPILKPVINKLLEVVKRKPLQDDQLLSSRDFIKTLLVYLLPRLINGIAFVVIAVSLFDIQPSEYIIFGSTYIVAGVIGMLAVFVPSGIGVRESVIVFFLSFYIPIEQAIILSVFSRLYATLADLGLGMTYWIIKRRR